MKNSHVYAKMIQYERKIEAHDDIDGFGALISGAWVDDSLSYLKMRSIDDAAIIVAKYTPGLIGINPETKTYRMGSTFKSPAMIENITSADVTADDNRDVGSVPMAPEPVMPPEDSTNLGVIATENRNVGIEVWYREGNRIPDQNYHTR